MSPEAVLRAEIDRLGPSERASALAAVEQLVGEPLRMVRSYLGLLERRLGDELDEARRELLLHAVDGAVRGQQLLDDLLRYSRVATQTADPAWVELDPLAGEAAAGPLGKVWGDPPQVGALLEALLTNARTFGSTTVAVRRAGVAVLVEDDGIGTASTLPEPA